MFFQVQKSFCNVGSILVRDADAPRSYVYLPARSLQTFSKGINVRITTHENDSFFLEVSYFVEPKTFSSFEVFPNIKCP